MAELQQTQSLSKYFNKKISLLSTSAVRYIGELHTVDPNEPSISLKNVQCLGTEDRRAGQQAIAASNVVYEFIRFRTNNIKSLQLCENNQKIDLNKDLLEPASQYNNTPQEIQHQQQTSSSKNASKQKNKPSIAPDEPKRKVGVPHPSNRSPPYDYYYPSQRSPQYAPVSQYDHPTDAYNPISPHQTGHDAVMYSPNYPYDSELHYSQNVNFPQVAPPQPQSSYYSRDTLPFNAEHDAILPANDYYYYQQRQQSPTTYGFTGPHLPPQANLPLTNTSSRGYDRPSNYNTYRQYGTRNYDNYQQSNTNNRPRYSNDRRQDQGANRGGTQGNQRYYNNPNARQGASTGGNRQRYNEVNPNVNQAPGTGAYLDRRLRGDDLNVSTTDFDFGTSNIGLEKSKDDKKSDDKTTQSQEKKQTSTTEENKKEATDNSNDVSKGNFHVETAGHEKEKTQGTESKEEKSKDTTDKAQEKKPAYDKNKSFFDSITTDADIKKQQPKIEEQRQNDAETFGSVAETYRSRHQLQQENANFGRKNINQTNFNQQQRRNYGYYNQQPGYNYRQQRYNNQSNANYQNQYYDNNRRRNNLQNNDSNFDNNPQRWVQKRTN